MKYLVTTFLATIFTVFMTFAEIPVLELDIPTTIDMLKDRLGNWSSYEPCDTLARNCPYGNVYSWYFDSCTVSGYENTDDRVTKIRITSLVYPFWVNGFIINGTSLDECKERYGGLFKRINDTTYELALSDQNYVYCFFNSEEILFELDLSTYKAFGKH